MPRIMALADIEEGASQIIIKPALSYLDIICRARQSITLPVIAYNVSGEYTMLRLMVEKGLAERLARVSHQEVRVRFDIRSHIRRIEEIYLERAKARGLVA